MKCCIKLRSEIVVKFQMGLTVALFLVLTLTQIWGFSFGHITLPSIQTHPVEVTLYFTALINRYMELVVFFVLFCAVRNKSLTLLRTWCWSRYGIYTLQTFVFSVNALFFKNENFQNHSEQEQDSPLAVTNIIFGWIAWIPLSLDMFCLPIHIMELEVPVGKNRQRSWILFRSILFKRIIMIQCPIYLTPMFLYTFVYAYKIWQWLLKKTHKPEDYYLIGLYIFKAVLAFTLFPMIVLLYKGLKGDNIARIILFYRLHLIFMYCFGVGGGIRRLLEEQSTQLYHNSSVVIVLSMLIGLHLSYVFLSIFLMELVIQLRVASCLPEPGETEESEMSREDLVSQNPLLFERIILPKKQIRICQDEKIGEGQFSEVFKALKLPSRKFPCFSSLCQLYLKKHVVGEVVAVKILKPDSNRTYSEALGHELKILDGVGQHPHLVKFYGCCFWRKRPNHESVIGIVLEYCSLGSLESYLEVLSNLETPIVDVDILELIRISKEIAEGMSYLEEKKIVHADLAARNVLLTNDKMVKITDFGMSLKLYYYQVYATSTGDLFPWKSMAPEALTDLKFSSKSDIWSYGILLHEIFSLGDDPFPDHVWTSHFVQELMDGLRPPNPKLGGDSIFEIMSLCWDWDPKMRPEFKELFLRLDHL